MAQKHRSTVSLAGKKTSTASLTAEESSALLAIAPALEREARAVEATRHVPFRLNAKVARLNVQKASASVLGQREAIEAKVKKPNFKAVERLEALVDAVDAASRAVTHLEGTTGNFDTDVARLWELRSLLLGLAILLADAKVLPKKAVDTIRAGKGVLDGATDLIDLVDLFTKNMEKIRTKLGPVTPEDIAEAKVLGARLTATIRPTKVKRTAPKDEQKKAAIQLRDGLYALLVEGHETTWVLGANVFGSKVDAFVPPLNAGSR